MKILLIILLVLAALTAAVLLLPVSVEIKNGENGELKFDIKLLFFKLGNKPKKAKKKSGTPDMIMSVFGIDKIKNKETRAEGIEQTARLLKSLFKEARAVIGHCVAKKFIVRVVCTDDDPADAAMSFGTCCAFVYPVVVFLKSELKKVKKSGEYVKVYCDFNAAEESFDYRLVLTVRICHVLASLIRIIFREARAQAEQ